MSKKRQPTTLEERVTIAERASAGKSSREIAEESSRPVATIRKWRQIYNREGRAGLVSKMGRPAAGALAQSSVEMKDAILEMREEHPGWPRAGGDWYDAQDACQHLNEDGLTLTPLPQNIWRLPTVDDAVRSMARHGQNSAGVWDAETAEAINKTRPDKESPLWYIYSQVIYWWTATEIDQERTNIIVYDGKVWPRSKDFGLDYLGFRCVKNP